MQRPSSYCRRGEVPLRVVCGEDINSIRDHPQDGLLAFVFNRLSLCPLSSPDPSRFVNFLGFAGLAVHFLANYLLGDLG